MPLTDQHKAVLRQLDEKLGIDLSTDKPQRSKVVTDACGNRSIEISALTVKEQNQMLKDARKRP